MTWTRWKRAPWQTDEDYLTWYGLTEDELNQLSRYNSERSRGIPHTEQWGARMAELQRRFDEAEGRPRR